METKLCECGCGQPTPLCKYNLPTQGYIAGQPLRFIPGHQCRGRKQRPEEIAARSAAIMGHPVSDETRRKISNAHKASGHKPTKEAIDTSNSRRKKLNQSPSWKGGISLVNGYRCAYAPDHSRCHPNGYVYEHILIAEKQLGRSLSGNEVVHHIDGNKLNNSPDNLTVLASQAEHIRLHRSQGDID